MQGFSLLNTFKEEASELRTDIDGLMGELIAKNEEVL